MAFTPDTGSCIQCIATINKIFLTIPMIPAVTSPECIPALKVGHMPYRFIYLDSLRFNRKKELRRHLRQRILFSEVFFQDNTTSSPTY